MGPAWWLSGKESGCNAGYLPGEGNGNPFQYLCLENPGTQEPGGLQSTGLQKSWTQPGDWTPTTKNIIANHPWKNSWLLSLVNEIYQMNLEYGSLPQSILSKVSGGTETNMKVSRTSPSFWFAPIFWAPLFSMSFLGSLFCLWPINVCIPFWTYFGSHSILSHFLAQSFLLTNFQYKYLCYNMSYWKNPQVLQNWADLIRKIVSAVCSKPTQLCNLSANRKYKWSQGLD